ncbi:MAG: HAD family hydrolase [bacterium]|nr:HAD family hydrolase [bacterium]
MIKAILFDFGNTLVSTELDWEVIIEQNIASLLGYLVPALGRDKVEKETFGKAFLQIRKENFQKAEVEMKEYTAEESLAQMLEKVGIKNVPQHILEQAVDAFFAPEENLYPVFPEVPEVLTELKNRGYKLALVSNATSGRLIRKAAAGRDLTKYFETIIVSADVGYRKPHPKIYQFALDFLTAKPEETVMVGDLLEIDIAGAKKLGMKTILAKFVQPKENYNQNNKTIIPDAVASRFRDILTYIEKF